MTRWILLYLCLPILSFAEGIEIIYQIEFKCNGEYHQGYITGGYSSPSIDSTYLFDDEQFEKAIRSCNRFQLELEVYSVLKDWTVVKEKASFPMQPFEMGDKLMTYPIKDVNNLHLVKIWKRSDYHIKVLSPINSTDSKWYGNSYQISKPIGDDVGCRLEVFSFENHPENKTLIKKFTELYLNPKENDAIYYNYRKRLLELLYLNKVVIVELCGC